MNERCWWEGVSYEQTRQWTQRLCGVPFGCLQSMTLSERQRSIWKTIFKHTCIVLVKTSEKKSQKILLNFVMIKQSPAIRTSKGNPAVLNANDRHWLQGDFSNREPAHLKKHLSVHIKHVPLWRNQLIIMLLLAFIFFYSLPCRKAAYKYSNRLRGDVLPLRD